MKPLPGILPSAALGHRARRRSNRGFTLIEVVIATSLLAMGLAIAFATLRSAGRATVRSVLQRWNVDTAGLIQADGSGLSRYNYVTPETLVAILSHVDRDEHLRDSYEATLPVAGQDGTLDARMKGTAAEGNARMKTGSMSNVRTVAGYVRTADGEKVVFAILANNFEAPAGTITAAADAIVVRLATFRR